MLIFICLRKNLGILAALENSSTFSKACFSKILFKILTRTNKANVPIIRKIVSNSLTSTLDNANIFPCKNNINIYI